MNKGKWISKALVCCLTLCATTASPTYAQNSDTLGRTYDYLIKIETEKLKRYLEFTGSPFVPIVKAAVTYRKPHEETETKYEDLFYKACDPLGCRRLHALDIGNNVQIAIQVSHKTGSGSEAEACAAANAILRLFLDAYLQGDMVARIFVPADSFSSIVSALGRANFYPGENAKPDQPVYSTIVLYLESDPPGSKQTMYYIGRTDQ